jgi:hypothetical protein
MVVVSVAVDGPAFLDESSAGLIFDGHPAASPRAVTAYQPAFHKVITTKNGHKQIVYVRLVLPVNGKIGKGDKVEGKAEKEDTNWYIHQLTTEELKEFIEEARKGKDTRKAFIGTVMPEAKQRI